MKGHIPERSPGHWAILDARDPATGCSRRIQRGSLIATDKARGYSRGRQITNVVKAAAFCSIECNTRYHDRKQSR
jgi:hypothetical protein